MNDTKTWETPPVQTFQHSLEPAELDRMMQASAALSKGLSQHWQMEIQRISESCAAMVQAFGTSSEQAAKALAAFSTGIKVLKEEEKPLRAKRPWYRRGRW